MKIRSGGLVCFAVACWGALAGPAWAQESRSLSPAERRFELSRESGGLEATIAVQGRLSFLAGTADPDIPADYGDLFKSGLGVAVEGTLLWKLGPKWRLGPYLSIGWDGYDGKADTDDFGDTLEPDKMDITTFLVGARARLALGPHFAWEVHMGFGAAHYSTVNGVLTLGGVPEDVKVFKASTVFAFDLGTRFEAQAGPLFFDLGIGFRTQSAPGTGDLALNSGALSSFGIEFGAGVRF